MSRRSTRRADGPLARLASIPVPAPPQPARLPRARQRDLHAARLAALVVGGAVAVRMLPPDSLGRLGLAAVVASGVAVVSIDGMAVRMRGWAAQETCGRRELEPDAVLAALVLSAPWMVVALFLCRPVLGPDVEPLVLAAGTLGLIVLRALARAADAAAHGPRPDSTGVRCVQWTSTITACGAATITLGLALDHHLLARDVARVWAGAAVVVPLATAVVRARRWAAFDEVHVRSLVRASTWCAAAENARVVAWSIGAITLGSAVDPSTTGRYVVAFGAVHAVVTALAIAARGGRIDDHASLEVVLRRVRRSVLVTTVATVGLAPVVPVALAALTGDRTETVAFTTIALLPGAAALVLLFALDPLVEHRCGPLARAGISGAASLAGVLVTIVAALRHGPVLVASVTSAVLVVSAVATLVVLADRSDRVARSVVMPDRDDLRWLTGGGPHAEVAGHRVNR